MRTELDLAQLAAALDEWAGAEIAVRVVSAEDDLVAVAHGHLGPRTSGKHPALFWPVGDPRPGPEEPGIYLHPDAFEQASAREGEFVLELRQGGVTLNLRRL